MSFRRSLPLLPLALALLAIPSCGGSGPEPAESADALTLAKDQKRTPEARAAAVERVWAERQPGERGRDAARESLKSIAWQVGAGAPTRTKAIETLLADPDDAGQQDTRRMLALMLPLEPDGAVTAFIAERAAAWPEFAGPLCRAWAKRPIDAIAERAGLYPERAALAALAQGEGQTLQAYLVKAFATAAPTDAGPRRREEIDKGRRAAWEVLSRIDPDGTERSPLIANLAAPESDTMLAALRACASGLRAVPLTGAQLAWAERLRDFADPNHGPANRAWWTSATAAVARLSPAQSQGLALRHAEAVRTAAEASPAYLSMDRETLVAELRQRLRPRSQYGRYSSDAGQSDFGTGRLDEVEARLSWGDALAALVVDDALRTPGMAEAFDAQAERDRVNTTTEYGGLIALSRPRAPTATSPRRFVATLYIPRPNQQRDDRAFVASEEMIFDGRHALAHYHFHAQQIGNRDYAGPSPGDLLYAREQGVTCVVLTSIRPGLFNADYYLPTGVVIDLGDVRVAESK
jgi:hypothetical protein